MTDKKKHRKEIKKWLEVKYTEQEISDMSMDLAQKTGELRHKEDNKKSVMSQLKAEIDTLLAETNEISGKMIAGREMRNIKCELEYDYEKNRKTIIRIDLMEYVYEGPIPDEEWQIEMGIDKLQDEVTELKEEIMPGEHEVNPELIKTEEQQAGLDREDAEIANEIANNLDESKKNPLIAQGNIK